MALFLLITPKSISYVNSYLMSKVREDWLISEQIQESMHKFVRSNQVSYFRLETSKTHSFHSVSSGRTEFTSKLSFIYK